jgi:hypothetical protein
MRSMAAPAAAPVSSSTVLPLNLSSRAARAAWAAATASAAQRPKKMRIVALGDFGWEIAHEGRYATPADSPRHDGSPYRRLRVRRWGLGFVHYSRVVFFRTVPNPNVRFATFLSLYVTDVSRRLDEGLGSSRRPHRVLIIKPAHPLYKGAGCRFRLTVNLYSNPNPTAPLTPPVASHSAPVFLRDVVGHTHLRRPSAAAPLLAPPPRRGAPPPGHLWRNQPG